MGLKELRIGDLCAKIPVIQGGMGVGISLHRLAGAVAAEGGVGIISTAQIGYREPDMVVIEGPDAGGHLGFTPEKLTDIPALNYDTEISRIIEYVHGLPTKRGEEIPVVVAGGIYTREDAEHAVSLGAAGVQMGTRFVTTPECDASDAYKQAYINAKKEDIVIVQSPVGMLGRAINNAFLKKAKEGRIPHGKCHLCVSTCKPAETPYCITDALINAAVGNVDEALLFCGTNAYRAEKLESVSDIMREFAVKE